MEIMWTRNFQNLCIRHLLDYEKIVNDKGGFHNRLTGQIHLKPFTLKECKEYLQAKKILLNRHQIIQCYMIMGGVPYYWSLLKKGRSLPQAKYSKADFRVDAAFDKDMRHKISDYMVDSKTKHAIHPTLITNYGIVENEYSSELQPVITGEELFR